MNKPGILSGCKILILMSNGYHEHEFWFPYYRFLEEDAQIFVAGPCQGTVYGEGRYGKDGLKAVVEYTVEEASQLSYDVLYLPGGIFSPLELRNNQPTLELVRNAMKSEKIVAAICHAQWILVSAGVLAGRKLTCPPDIAIDVQNAGGIYLEQACVRDGNLITAVYYAYLPQQFKTLLPAIQEYMLTQKR